MSIRTKCALLILAFELVLCVTLLLTVRYIGAYFDDAARTLATSNSGLADISRLRTLVRNQLVHLVRLENHLEEADECLALAKAIKEAANGLIENSDSTTELNDSVNLDTLLTDVNARVDGYVKTTAADTQRRPFDPQAHIALDARLGLLESRMLAQAGAKVDDAFAGQRRAILILWINAIVGVILGIAGLILIRRWVLNPIHELQTAADKIGKGNLEHRAAVTSSDEFGRLAAAVNQMSADLARLERQMIQRERLAAMGELISFIAHNIRNPLAGIQASAEAAARDLPPESDARTHADAIVSAVVRFQSWLRQLEHTCSPLEIAHQDVSLNEIVDNVVTVFRPMSQRRGVTIETRLNGKPGNVRLDPRHFEHALAALVGNAIEAAPDSGRVIVGAKSNGDPSHWQLFIRDDGPGIAAGDRDRIFEPTFSTKRGGHGLGLAMARKIIEMHGGNIQVECPADGGSEFTVIMPTHAPPGDQS